MTTRRPLRILLVEDDSAIASVIAIAMHSLGVPYQLDQANSAEEGLELWDEQPYDLLLTDYNLRGMNGLTLITRIKRAGGAAPTVLFTAYDTPKLRREARDADISKFVAKPFVIDDFVAMARDLLPLHAQTVGGAQADPALS